MSRQDDVEKLRDRPHIDQDTLDVAWKVSGQVARGSTTGRLAGQEECYSEALVLVVELADQYDPDRGLPWLAYLTTMLRFRLIDWLRTQYGRGNRNLDAEQKGDARWLGHVMAQSLDEQYADGSHVVPRDQVVETEPGPEEVVLARATWSEFLAALEELTDVQRDCLLWPARANNARAVIEEHGLLKGGQAYQRKVAKQAVGEAIGREIQVRIYPRRKAA